MQRRYLFGPVSNEFADQNLRRHISAGTCVVFDHSQMQSSGSWDNLVERLSSGFEPEYLVLHLQYSIIPEALWRAPVPIIGLGGDWNLLWHHYRHILPRCDLVLADSAGVEAMKRQGIGHASHAELFGCERAFVEFSYPDGPRDIDILFVGNFHAAVQYERLPWLGRVAMLGERWKVHLATGVFGDDYRRLLGRARIVFNRSIRGECNNRTFEAVAARALLFQESENRDIRSLLREGEEFVAYDDANLEERLEFFLTHEEKRRNIALRAWERRSEFTFDALWQRAMETIEMALPETKERAAQRSTLPVSPHERTWQLVSSTLGNDEQLHFDLKRFVGENRSSAELQNDFGVALWQHQPRDGQACAAAFQNAWNADPRQVVAGLNLAEILVHLGQKAFAVEQSERTLAMLDLVAELPAWALDAVRVLTEFDEFWVEWEKAAWQHTCDRRGEETAKRRLLRWRLCQILAEVSNDDSVRYFQMWAQRPDLAASNRELGCALGRARRPMEALPYLQQSLALNPFDGQSARALNHTLGLLGRTVEQLRLAKGRRRLNKSAPELVPEEPWFAEEPPSAATQSPRQQLRIVWHGTQRVLHSLALVNRELCQRLLCRGHELSLLEPEIPEPPSRRTPLSEDLGARLRAKLTSPADVHVSHQWPPDFTPPAEGHWVIIQPWEFGSVPKAWIAPLTQIVDEVWVPSRFVRNTFVQSGIPADQVHVIPNGVADHFFQEHSPFALATKKRFKFLFVGGTIERKGIDLLLKAYTQVFSDRHEVCLIIKDTGVGQFYRGQTIDEKIAYLKSAPHAPEIEYFSDELSPEELAGLYQACDCLVHPYRGEGFGLPIAEALASGLPVIVTGFGAALDYCREEFAYLIPARAEFLPKEPGALETVDRPFWAKPDLDALRFLVRHVVEHPDEAKEKARKGRKFLQQHFTWDHAAAAVESRLQTLQSKPVRRLLHQPPQPTFVVGSFRPRVSLTMIVKNEEDNLPACLDSVADLMDELIVVDTGSTDRTIEIAQARGAKVHHFPWIDNFAAARNEALQHAAGEWVFWMDADDRLDADNRAKLKMLFGNLPGNTAGYVMKCLCLPDPETGSSTVVDHVRLFRHHPELRWEHRIHEQILPSIRRLGGSVQWADVVIQHVGYQDAGVRRRKLERDLRLLLMEQQEMPDHPFTLFNLGQVYQEQGNFADALIVLQKSLERSNPTDSIVRKLYSLVSQCQRRLGQLDAALGTCQSGRSLYSQDAELLFQESTVRREQGDLNGAIACLEQVLGSQEKDLFASVDTGLRGYKARNNLAVNLKEAGRLAEAEAQWRLALEEAPDFLPGLLGLAQVGLDVGRFEFVEEMIQRIASHPKGASESELLRARVRFKKGDFAAARALVTDMIARRPSDLVARVLLSHVLLKEGRDLDAAERALHDILALDPNHAEARQNLAVLSAQKKS
ncbi:MAG: glycosyltransferase [Gemmataceae bacterium]|nr:glycosyltransferase [Gemmataceae bacterium]